MLEHRRDAAAVLALEPVVGVEPLLHLLEPAGLGREPQLVAAQLARQVLRLDPERAQARGERVELGVDAGDGLGQPLGLGEQRGGPGGIALRRERLRTARAGGAQAFQVAEPVALGHELGLLRLVRRERLDLADLEDEQVEVALAVAHAAAQVGQVRAQLADARVRRGVFGALRQLAVAAERVEHLELGR